MKLNLTLMEKHQLEFRTTTTSLLFIKQGCRPPPASTSKASAQHVSAIPNYNRLTRLPILFFQIPEIVHVDLYCKEGKVCDGNYNARNCVHRWLIRHIRILLCLLRRQLAVLMSDIFESPSLLHACLYTKAVSALDGC